MTDPLHALYQARPYPPMSHPVTHPALIAAAATLAGLDPVAADHARVLEIGCASGHNLLPLAQAYPQAQFVGVDFSEPAIQLAREAATAAKLNNISFVAKDLRAFDPGEDRFDYVIAHGVFSWVDQQTQTALLDLCQKALAPSGVACISYNVLPGWALRQPLAMLAGALAKHPSAAATSELPLNGLPDLFDAFFAESTTSYGEHLRQNAHDMAAKGPDILAFDDLAPINQPCYFVEFLDAANRAGLRYLGESNPSENTPTELPDAAREKLKVYADDPRLLQQLIDFLLGRTFRTSLLSRTDGAELIDITYQRVLGLAARTSLRHAGSLRDFSAGARMRFTSGEEDVVTELDHPEAKALLSSLIEVSPACPPLSDTLAAMHALMQPGGNHDISPPRLARLVMDGVRHGWIELRAAPVAVPPHPGAMPAMSPLHLHHAGRNEPLVDVYHQPCSFREPAHYPIAAAMDGTRTLDELAEIARQQDPALDFRGWLHHLHIRGLVQ
jgi:SAM-dependent methyltransferase